MTLEKSQIDVIDDEGKVIGQEPIGFFCGLTEVNRGLIHQIVRWQRAKSRAGTHSVLTRAMASGGGKKPWKQKGTGNARSGSNTSPLWVGGGIAHGPKPRSYEFSLNKRQRKDGLRQVLFSRYSEGRLRVVKDVSFPSMKTKEAAAFFSRIGLPKGASTLVVIADDAWKNERVFRNIPGVKVVRPEGLNVYDVVAAQHTILWANALPSIEDKLAIG